jgi:hypothetical protein
LIAFSLGTATGQWQSKLGEYPIGCFQKAPDHWQSSQTDCPPKSDTAVELAKNFKALDYAAVGHPAVNSGHQVRMRPTDCLRVEIRCGDIGKLNETSAIFLAKPIDLPFAKRTFSIIEDLEPTFVGSIF